MRLGDLGAAELEIALGKHAKALVGIVKDGGGELFRDDAVDRLASREHIPASDTHYVITYARAEGLLSADNERTTLYLEGKKGSLKTSRTRKEIADKRRELTKAKSEYNKLRMIYEQYRPEDTHGKEQAFWASVALEDQIELLEWLDGKQMVSTGYSAGVPKMHKIDIADLDKLGVEEFAEKYDLKGLLVD